MIKVYGRKGQVLMIVKSFEKAVEGMRKGSYKIGDGYRMVDEESGEVKNYVKFICYRKQSPAYYFDYLDQRESEAPASTPKNYTT